MKKQLIILAILNVILFSGCAFSRTETKIDYSPNIHAASLSSLSAMGEKRDTSLI